ncbi:MAG: acetyl-CoA C-acyltransferase [Gammaproteobacteria bacterium]|nr:acetyl-CoA C-acyltransferase [Gammaproteobacteria bacterium]
MNSDEVVIVAAKRSPLGAFQGSLSGASSPEIAAATIRACLDESGVDTDSISEVFMGCVLPAGLGQAPARQAAIKAGVPLHVGCTTINKVCGSGMKATMLGNDLIRAGSANIVVAGGMESMSNAPYLMPKARGGYRMGHQEVLDHMFFDGLQNPSDGNMMGHFAELTAKKYGFSREDQDAFAIESVTRARAAMSSGAFVTEITPVTTSTRKGAVTVTEDEGPGAANLDKIAILKPAFAKDGTVTAASSSSISDGAAALILMSASEAKKRGLKALATIVGHSGFAHEPEWFTTAPVFAIRALHEKLGWNPDTVDLYEINEAFACVTMAAMVDLGLDHRNVNVNGGACALGHPIGATGARIIVTLLHALRNRKLKRGIASLCIGGGEATAIGIEIN